LRGHPFDGPWKEDPKTHTVVGALLVDNLMSDVASSQLGQADHAPASSAPGLAGGWLGGFVGRLLLPKVREVMSHPVVTVESGASVLAVVEAMANSRVGSVVVVEGNAPTAMFTRHDLFERVMKVKKDPAQTPVGEVSSKPLATIGPKETLTAAVAKMKRYGYSRLVVMEKEQMVGILTNTDIQIRFSRGYMSSGLMLKKLAVDTAAYAIFWSSFSYIISVLIVGIGIDKYLVSSAIGWIVTIAFAGVYGRFLDIFREKFSV